MTKATAARNDDYFLSSSHLLLLIEHATNGLVDGSDVEVNKEIERFTVVCSRCR